MTSYPVDLTMPLREGIPAYPAHGRSVLSLSSVMKHADFAGKGRFNPYDGAEVSFAVTQWLIGDQAGTHMDAPFHADPDSPYTIEALPLDRLWGPAVWLDCVGGADGGVTVERLEDSVKASEVELREDDILLIRTGASETIEGAPTDYAQLAWGLTREAAEWIRAHGVKLLGIDCVTIETPVTAREAVVHTNFLRPRSLGLPADSVIPVIENLQNIQAIPDHRFTFVGFPLPLVGAAGSPVRAVALPPLTAT